MDAIRKKMQTMKAEMDDYTKKISVFEKVTSDNNAISDKLDADLRDIGKKVQSLRMESKRHLKIFKYRPQS